MFYLMANTQDVRITFKDEFPPINHVESASSPLLLPENPNADWYWGEDAGYFLVDGIGRYRGCGSRRIHDIPIGWLLYTRNKSWSDETPFGRAFDRYYTGLKNFAHQEPGLILIAREKKHSKKSIRQCRDQGWLREIIDCPGIRNNPEHEVPCIAIRAWLANPRKYSTIRDIGERTSQWYDNRAPAQQHIGNVFRRRHNGRGLADYKRLPPGNRHEMRKIAVEYTPEGYQMDGFVVPDSAPIKRAAKKSKAGKSSSRRRATDAHRKPSDGTKTRRSRRIAERAERRAKNYAAKRRRATSSLTRCLGRRAWPGSSLPASSGSGSEPSFIKETESTTTRDSDKETLAVVQLRLSKKASSWIYERSRISLLEVMILPSPSSTIRRDRRRGVHRRSSGRPGHIESSRNPRNDGVQPLDDDPREDLPC